MVTESLYDLGHFREWNTHRDQAIYKQLVRKYHPDVSPPERIEEHTKRFIQVQEAYETLSDPISRVLYDKHWLCFEERVEKRVAEAMAVSTDTAEEKEHEAGFEGQHVMGSRMRRRDQIKN
ncbi:chaperone protein dnaJ 20, chloroplastic-like [Pistacia vera]|uniref:chaperone protein dnaJ 20, chloroplastic-like n=1 Tax=Pistacia vera TaxID=55513 RepID=UPI001263E331|nr:chaperone protein dnaJ 20, chloroplastic-like [Pistacia vera]